MINGIVAIIVAATIGIVIFRRVRRRGPSGNEETSTTRTSLAAAFVTINALFGFHYRPPRVEIPVVTQPAPGEEDEPPRPSDGVPLNHFPPYRGE